MNDLKGSFKFAAETGEEEKPDETPPLEVFKKRYGGHWGPGHPEFTVDAWRIEVESHDTRMGYWEWAWAQIYGR